MAKPIADHAVIRYTHAKGNKQVNVICWI